MNNPIVVEIQQKTIQDATTGSNYHCSFSVNNDAPVNNGQYIEKGEYTPYAACNVDDGRDNKGVRQKLRVGKPNEVF